MREPQRDYISSPHNPKWLRDAHTERSQAFRVSLTRMAASIPGEVQQGWAENKGQGRFEKGLNFESALQPKHLSADRKWKPSRL